MTTNSNYDNEKITLTLTFILHGEYKMSEFETAKKQVLAQLDAFTNDLRSRIEAVKSPEELQHQSIEARKVTDEILEQVTGGIMDLGVAYTPYTKGATPPAHIHPSTHNSWAHDQNVLIMKHNLKQSTENTKLFFTGHFSRIDNTYETGYWPTDTGK